MSSGIFNIANYYTNVDLALGLTTNLVETELALKLNPNTFSTLILFDQANGNTKSPIPYKKDPAVTAAFPTDWNGINDYASDGFGQDIWTATGIGLIEASNLDQATIRQLLDEAKKYKASYSNLLQYILNKTGSSYQLKDPNSEKSFLGFTKKEIESNKQFSFFKDLILGVSTKFVIPGEMQTGSPLSVDYLLEQSRSTDYFGENPHALFLANHGGSFTGGGNGDSSKYDNDPQEEYLQVKDFAQSLQKTIAASSGNERLGLVAYDECLMANIELVTELKSSTRYVLASQEVIPGNGYDYFRTLSDFNVTTALTTQEQIEAAAKDLGNAFINTYSERNPDKYSNLSTKTQINTLSLTDTNYVDSLNTAIKSYADALISSSNTFIASLLKAIRQKGTFYQPGLGFGYLQDLGNVALISKYAPKASTELVAASDAILAALSNVIVSNNQNYDPLDGFGLNKSSGLTITLPTELQQHIPPNMFIAKAPAFEAATGWSRVIQRILPILKKTGSNSGTESSKAALATTPITNKDGSQAVIALQIEGYLSHTSSNQAINENSVILPLFTAINDNPSATVGDLELHLNILNLNESGSIKLAIQGKDGTEKASWQQTINNAELYPFIGADLNDSAAVRIEKGDKVVITPDESIQARYDLDLKALDQSLGELANGEKPNFNAPILLNSKAVNAKDYNFTYTTPIAPPGEDFTTDIVLLSGSEGSTSLTIKNRNSGASKTFTSKTYIDEYVKFKGNSTYEFTVSYNSPALGGSDGDGGNAGNVSISSDLSLLVDHYASETFLLKDSVLTSSIELDTWGQYSINPALTSELIITEMVTDAQITNLNDLREGQRVNADISTSAIRGSSTLNEAATGGTQTFSSGIWSSEFDYTFNTIIEGTSANAAQFSFFEVDTLTGGISTEAGLIAASNNEAYRDAALDNLIVPLIDLKDRNKSTTFSAKIKAGTNYAAILLSTDESGQETALFSIASANPNQNAQLLNFGQGYFGWEDLVNGRDSGYDGDFNDLTFHTT